MQATTDNAAGVGEAPVGTLVLVVGPSGAGKDTLLDHARVRLRDETRVTFCRRVITRPADAGGEEHWAVTDAEFAAGAATGAYALSWSAHGLSYGVPVAMLDDLRAGRTVVVNVSRRAIAAAEALGFPTLVVNITAEPETLARRIAARGRESEAEIAARLAREVPLALIRARLIEIRNDTTIEAAGEALVGTISALLTRPA